MRDRRSPQDPRGADDDTSGRGSDVIHPQSPVAERRPARAESIDPALVAEAIPGVAWVLGPDGREVYANRSWRSYAGDAAGTSDWREAVHPADREHLDAAWTEATASDTPFALEFRLRSSRGEYRWHIGRGERARGGAGRNWVLTATDVHEMRRAQERLGLLSRTNELLAEHADVPELFSRLTALVVPVLADWAAVEMFDGDGHSHRVAWAGADEDAAGSAAAPDNVDATRPAAEPPAGARGDGAERETEALEPIGPDDAPRGGRAAMVTEVPLAIREGDRLGSLVLGRRSAPFDRSDVRLAEDLARRVVVTLDRERLYDAERRFHEAARRAAERMANLQAITAELADAPTPERVAEVVVDRSIPTLDASARAMAVAGPDGATFTVLRSVGFPASLTEAWASFTAEGRALPSMAVRTGQPVVMDRLEQRTAADPSNEAGHRDLGEGSFVALPLMAESRPIGVIVLFHAGRGLQPEEMAYLESVAGQCVQALVRARLRRQAVAASRGRAESLALLDTLVEGAPVGLGYWDASMRTVRVNEALAGLLGEPAPRLKGQAVESLLEPASGRRLDRRFRAVLRTRAPLVNRELEVRDRGSATRRWLVSAYPVPGSDGDVTGVGAVITDITDRSRAEAGARFMAEASQVLGESLDHEATVASLAALAVPRIADWCSVEMLEPDGSARQLAVAHVDPEKLALARRLRQQYPLGPDAPMGAPAVGRTGLPEVLWEIPQETLDALSPDPELRQIVIELGLRSYMCVPMVGPEGVIGAITFVQGASGRIFDERDLALATDLARHAATAIERARLYRDVTRLAATLDAVRDAILVFDPQTLVFTHVNQGAVDQVGYTREELLRMTPLDVKPLYDERAYRGLIEPLVDGTLRSRTISTLHRHKDGRLIPVEVSMQFVKLDGADGRLVSIARDVTERVEAEARLHRLAQSEQSRAAEFAAVIGAIGDAVVVCSPHGDVTHVNPAARRLFGGSLATWERVRDQLEDPDGRAPAPGVPAQQGPVELRRRNREQWLALTAYPVLGEAPQAGAAGRPVIATIVLIRDVTESRHAQRAQEAFIGVLSHELRTPVTTIYGGAKVLGERGDTLAPDVRADVYRDIAAESERLYRLVEDLLVLARFEGVTPGSLGDEPVLLQRILPAIVDVERSRFPATVFAAEMAPGLPTVRAERTYVEQVTRNLLANAAKYSPTGSTVRMQITPAEGAVEVRVTDEGPGFPEEEADRLFELFYRSPSTARVASGAGIGLFVCRRLVEAMGGRMWARPRPEGGSEFGFSLITFNEEEA